MKSRINNIENEHNYFMARSVRVPRRDTSEMRDDKSNYLDKQLEAEKRSKVYSTEIINKLLSDDYDGKGDMMPFFHGKTEWRNADITFEYTAEEWQELQKCAEEPLYFVEKYCTFLTDSGRRTVQLREYQQETIHLICDEVYDEKIDMFRPKNPKVVMMMSRQTGKCFSMTNHVNLKCGDEIINIPFFELYYKSLRKISFLDKFAYYLYKHNSDGKFDNLIYFCDKLKFGSNSSEKILETNAYNCNVSSDTNNGFTTITHIHRTKPFEIYKLSLEDDISIDCADEHLVWSSVNYSESWKFAKDLTTDDYIKTECGWKRVISVENTHKREYMCDISVDNDKCSYYCNGILSHNTTTTSACCVHYLCFHTDRNAMVVANKGRTAEEVLEKIVDVIKGLPFWLKPGVRSVSKDYIKFENGCTLKCAATSDTPATGSSLHLIIVDEAALVPQSRMTPFWQSIYPTMSSSNIAQIIVLSTPRGKHNLFYDLIASSDMTYKRDDPRWNGFTYKRVDYWQVPGHDTEEWKQRQIAVFGEANFNQEFGLSFESDASKLVSPTDLKWMNDNKQKFVSVDIYGIPYNVSSKIFWHPDFHPDLLTEEDLMKRRFLLQVDTAEGKQKGEKGQEDTDWNIINIYEIEFLSPDIIETNRLGYKEVTIKDCVRFRQIGIYMDQDFDEEYCADAARHLVFTLFKNGVETYNGDIDNCRINLEVNFNGVNWIKKFSKHDLFYPALILKTYHSQKAKTKEYGFKTVGGKHGKGYFCESGARMIAKQQLLITQDHEIASCSSIQQLESFGKNKSGVYDGGHMHDDIAVTVLFVSIALENEDFVMWLDDWFYQLSISDISYEAKQLLNNIAIILDTYVTQNINEDEYTEQDYTNLYSTAASGFNQNPTNNMSYSSFMNPINPQMSGMSGMPGRMSGINYNPFGGNIYNQSPQFMNGNMNQQIIIPRK